MTHIRTLMDQMIQIDEGRMKDIFTADEEGKSAKEIAKALKLPLGTVKKILGEDNDLQEFSSSQLDILAKQYAGLSGKTISVDNANKLRQIFKRIPDSAMDALRRKKIPFLSGLALSRMVQKGMPVKEDKEEPKLETGKDGKIGPAGKIALAKEKDTDALEAQLVTAKGQIELLKTKLENEKNKAVKPEPNKETGEVPLTVGVAHKYLKDKAEKEKEKKEDVKEEVTAVYTDKQTRQVKSKKFKDIKTANDYFRKSKEAAGQITYKEDVKEMAKDDAYAIGMAQAKKSMNDEKPLEKKTITKGHEIAKKILAKEGKSAFRLSYDDRYGKHAGFEDAETLADLQNKAANLRKKGFKINKMGRNTSPVKEENLKEADPITYGPDKVAKAMAIAVKSDGQYSKAVREIEKIGKDLSKVSTIARALKTANEDRHAGAKAVYEQIKGLKNKAEKTGMPYGILKKVYDRGMAAWRGGHRPGTTQQQWAFARVNSFVTKSSGTWGGADKDLAKQVKG